MLKILGARPHEPRPFTSAGMEIPFSLWLYEENNLCFDSGKDCCNVTFSKFYDKGVYTFETFELRASDVNVMEVYCKFFKEWNAFFNDNSLNGFLTFLAIKKIPLVHWWDGMFYSNPETKCFKWYYNGCSQGRLFADSQIAALKRIQKRGKYSPDAMNNIRVEEVEFRPDQHLKIPEWILNNKNEY